MLLEVEGHIQTNMVLKKVDEYGISRTIRLQVYMGHARKDIIYVIKYAPTGSVMYVTAL